MVHIQYYEENDDDEVRIPTMAQIRHEHANAVIVYEETEFWEHHKRSGFCDTDQDVETFIRDQWADLSDWDISELRHGNDSLTVEIADLCWFDFPTLEEANKFHGMLVQILIG